MEPLYFDSPSEKDEVRSMKEKEIKVNGHPFYSVRYQAEFVSIFMIMEKGQQVVMCEDVKRIPREGEKRF